MLKRNLGPLLFGLIGCAILISLSIWQFQRMQWKEGLIAAAYEGLAAAPVPLPENPTEAKDEYTPVLLDGEILAGEVHVLTSRPGQGPGFTIIAPFQTADGRRILLDRGFVREAEKDATRPLGPIAGPAVLLWPDESDSYTPAPDLARNFWFARDVTPMAEELATLPILAVITEAQLDGAPRPLPVTVNFRNRHLEYTVTWAGLAVAWAFMTGVWITARERGTEKNLRV
ncbi:SURF1 family protein [Pontivivens insulae]|uniref:SURF1-like protein n=1 Tax=Pontivivens insulae TaxID=1639689 RepID=A0A2R8A752_9RHOB|nr:SURF1 family protein [Pontivivens insulae]RED18129.1 surfeit locus 1 family protein [Pontivivens insulae]SPF28026.1 hypothetical protein POI8812_00323 [Pontivivens insulae]